MSYAKRLSARFLPCVLSASLLLAAAAAPVQAEGNWMMNGSKGLVSTVNWIQKEGSFFFLVPALNVKLVFSKFVLKSGLLTGEGQGTAEFWFTEGKVYSISTLEELPCTVGDLLFKVKSNLFLHEGETYNVLTPASGGALTITTYYGDECILSEENAVTGAMVLEDPNGLENEIVEHLVKQVAAGLFPTLEMRFGPQKMSLDGSLWLNLSGAHSGMKWSGVG